MYPEKKGGSHKMARPQQNWGLLTLLNKVWDEITYPFSNFNDAVIQVWEWVSSFIANFTGHVVTYPCWDLG